MAKKKPVQPIKRAHIKRNDQVMVIAGKDRGARGKVLRVLPQRNRAVVERINMVKHHTRPNPQKGIQGGVIEREAPIHLSNLMLICPETGEPSRVGRTRLEDGKGARVAKTSGAVIS